MSREEVDLRPMSELEPEKFFEFEGDFQDPDQWMALLENLQRRQFPLRETGVSSRVFNHWRKLGLVPGGESDGKWMYFDLIEYLWLMMIKDMRSFGFPLEIIATVKEQLFKEGFLQEVKLTEEAKTTLKNELEERLGESVSEEGFASITEIYRNGFSFLPYYFSLIVLVHFQQQAKTYFHIYADGRIEVINKRGQLNEEIVPNDEPHLTLSLHRYMVDMLSDETKAAFLAPMLVVTEEESQVLQAMRIGNVKELTLRFIRNGKDERIDLITKRDGEIAPDKIGKYMQYLSTQKHLSVTWKTKAGKSCYFEIEDRKIIKKSS